MSRHCTVIGAGLTGASAASALLDAGWEVTVLEAEDETGGNCKTGTIAGQRYERHGPHIFHTRDKAVAGAAQPYLRPYTHTVSSCTKAGILSWPPQIDELSRIENWPDIRHELARRPDELPNPGSVSFRDYAIAVMGTTLYALFIEGYTWKQWNRDPADMSGIFAPKRIDLRTDGYRPLFRDPFQGWLDAEKLINDMLRRADVLLATRASVSDMPADEPVIVTAPLDVFVAGTPTLEWRGMILVHEYSPDRQPQPSPVMNYPQREDAHIRTTSAASMGLAMQGDIISYEYPSDSVMDYPVNDAAGFNRLIQNELARDLASRLPLAVPAGRLGTYAYINMDQAIRQGWNAAQKVMRMAE